MACAIAEVVEQERREAVEQERREAVEQERREAAEIEAATTLRTAIRHSQAQQKKAKLEQRKAAEIEAATTLQTAIRHSQAQQKKTKLEQRKAAEIKIARLTETYKEKYKRELREIPSIESDVEKTERASEMASQATASTRHGTALEFLNLPGIDKTKVAASIIHKTYIQRKDDFMQKVLDTPGVDKTEAVRGAIEAIVGDKDVEIAIYPPVFPMLLNLPGVDNTKVAAKVISIALRHSDDYEYSPSHHDYYVKQILNIPEIHKTQAAIQAIRDAHTHNYTIDPVTLDALKNADGVDKDAVEAAFPVTD